MKFELFMGCLGNGTTVCNKAVEENGDYKKLCHIAETGKITWHVKPGSIPGDALLKIEHVADTAFANWVDLMVNHFIDSMPEIKRYAYLLEKMPTESLLHVCRDLKEEDLYFKIQYMKDVLLEKSMFK